MCVCVCPQHPYQPHGEASAWRSEEEEGGERREEEGWSWKLVTLASGQSSAKPHRPDFKKVENWRLAAGRSRYRGEPYLLDGADGSSQPGWLLTSG